MKTLRKIGTLFVLQCSLLLIGYQIAGAQTATLYLQNSITGQLAVWYLTGTTVTDGTFITPTQNPAWTCVSSADFNGNGQADLLFQNFSSGQLAVWFLNGTSATGGAYIVPAQNPAWECVGVNKFEGTAGGQDPIFQNTSTGQLAIWYMRGTQQRGGIFAYPTPASGWLCVGTGDFNRDSWPDLVFQNTTTGQLVLWFMHSWYQSGSATLTPSQNPLWRCVALLAPLGSSQQYLIFQNQNTGAVAYWLLQGSTVSQGGYLPTPPSGWKIVAPR